jgi:hypothetical protein
LTSNPAHSCLVHDQPDSGSILQCQRIVQFTTPYSNDVSSIPSLLLLFAMRLFCSDIGLLTPAHTAYRLQSSCDVWPNHRYVTNEPSNCSEEVSEKYEDAVEFDYEADEGPAHQDE